MNFKYFKDVKTIEDLKKQYRKLAKQYHPDLGGTDAEMKIINKEYEKLFEQVKSGATGKERNANVNDGFREIIEAIINLEGLEIEICGTWLWVGGETYDHKETLKEKGFKFTKKKKKWYWTADKLTKRKRTKSMEWIRKEYGSEIVKESQKMIGA